MAVSVTAMLHFSAINKLPPAADPVYDLRGWTDLAKEIRTFGRQAGVTGELLVISDNPGGLPRSPFTCPANLQTFYHAPSGKISFYRITPPPVSGSDRQTR
jgi:hypothetical protein